MAVPVIVPKEGSNDECVLTRWRVKQGDPVKVGDVLCEAETDKSSIDIMSPADGTVLDVFYSEGQTAPLLKPIAVVGEADEAFEGFSPDAKEEEKKKEEAPAKEASAKEAPDKEDQGGIASDKIFATPRARKVMAENRLSASEIPGTGPNGAVLLRDVRQYLNRAEENGKMRAGEDEIVSEEVLVGIRRTIAQRLLSSLRESAQYTLNAQADADAMFRLRKRLKNLPAENPLSGVTVGDMLNFAVVRTLKRYPELNATLEQDKYTKYAAVHLAVAVDTPHGLVTPVIRNAQNMSILAMAEEKNRLASAARERKLSPGELAGGTFTVSNLGSFGITTFTPILNPPQVCILGIGKTRYCPVDESGELARVIDFSLTLDHRAVDGAFGARFLQSLSDCLNEIDLQLMMA